jgi:hypothetical protein
MTQGQPMHIVLRLLVLLSIVGGGIKPKSFDGLRREFLQVCVTFSWPPKNDT